MLLLYLDSVLFIVDKVRLPNDERNCLLRSRAFFLAISSRSRLRRTSKELTIDKEGDESPARLLRVSLLGSYKNTKSQKFCKTMSSSESVFNTPFICVYFNFCVLKAQTCVINSSLICLKFIKFCSILQLSGELLVF